MVLLLLLQEAVIELVLEACNLIVTVHIAGFELAHGKE
jgi:hypothetical protein